MLNRPFLRQPTIERDAIHAQGLRPFSKRLLLPGIFENYKSLSRISALFFCCGPAAVRWGIRSVGSHSVEGRSFGAFPHVTKKVLKTRGPAFANFDAPAAIDRKILVARIFAAIFHRIPRSVFSRSRFPVSDVGFCHARRRLFSETSAGAAKTLFQVGRHCEFLAPAGARAKPHDATAHILRPGNYGQPSESFPGEIFNVWHFPILQDCHGY